MRLLIGYLLAVMVLTSCDDRPDVVMLGDSLTEYGEWQEHLESYNIQNLGVGGLKTAQLNELGLVKKVMRSDADIVTIMIGINDATNGNTMVEVQEAYNEVLLELEKGDFTVVVQACIYQGHTAHQSFIDSLNSFLASRSEALGFEFLDLNPVLSPGAVLSKAHTTDGTHLSSAAYDLWYVQLCDKLSRLR